jgi:hypothetical protein
MNAHYTSETAVEAIRKGASDYLNKPESIVFESRNQAGFSSRSACLPLADSDVVSTFRLGVTSSSGCKGIVRACDNIRVIGHHNESSVI